MKLQGAVVVVAIPAATGVAHRLVEEGATVVLTGADGEEAGRLLASLGDGPGRVAYFRGELDSDAFVEFVSEQFGARPPVS